jgi:hypothetical protein
MNNLDNQLGSSHDRLISTMHPDSQFFAMLLRAALIICRRWR